MSKPHGLKLARPKPSASPDISACEHLRCSSFPSTGLWPVLSASPDISAAQHLLARPLLSNGPEELSQREPN